MIATTLIEGEMRIVHRVMAEKGSAIAIYRVGEATQGAIASPVTGITIGANGDAHLHFAEAALWRTVPRHRVVNYDHRAPETVDHVVKGAKG
jgi:hypothetical protein